MLEFLCPQGHKIRCSDNQAGRAAKCPRCGVKFLIPIPTEHEVAQPGDDTTISRPELAEVATSGSSSSARQQGRPKEPQIEFLCPNGHHLHGPASLQGRPGECPECGSRFRIPTYEETPETTAPEEEISLAGLDGGPSLPPGLETPSNEDEGLVSAGGSFLEGPVGEPSFPPLNEPDGIPLVEPEPIPLEPEIIADGTDPASATVGHPLGALFARLWSIKGEGSRVELHMNGGEVLVAEAFANGLSQRNHGVFAVKDQENGTFTLMVVPWDLVSRVLMRGVKELPAELGHSR